MNIFYIPMDRSMSVAYLTVNFAGIDTEFTDSSGKKVKFPSGIAHVFEHMLFRRDDFDVMEEFKSMGTASNAFTSYDNTTYTTAFTQSPLKNIELLLTYVLNPVFTNKHFNVEKEVVLDEWRRREDDPWTKFWHLVQDSLYYSPYSLPIIGTEDDIKKNISYNMLLQIHPEFYHPSNIFLTIAGNINKDEAFNLVENLFNKFGLRHKDAKLIEPYNEPEDVKKKRVEDNFHNLVNPIAGIAYKNNKPNNFKDSILIEIINELLFGKGSRLNEELYNKGVTVNDLYTYYNEGRGFGYNLIYGYTRDNSEFEKRVLDEIRKVRHNGFVEEDLERRLRVSAGELARVMDSTKTAVSMFSSMAQLGYDLFSYINIAKSLTVDDANKVLNEQFRDGNFSVVTLNPRNK